jgi:hypothetical protein
MESLIESLLSPVSIQKCSVRQTAAFLSRSDLETARVHFIYRWTLVKADQSCIGYAVTKTAGASWWFQGWIFVLADFGDTKLLSTRGKTAEKQSNDLAGVA